MAWVFLIVCLVVPALHAAPALAQDLPTSEDDMVTELGQLGQGLPNDPLAVRPRLEVLVEHARTQGWNTALSGALTNLSATYFYSGQQQEALPIYQQLIALYQQTGNKAGEAEILGAQAALFYERGDMQALFGSLLRARTLAEESGDAEALAGVLVNLANAVDLTGDEARSLELNQQALEAMRQATAADPVLFPAWRQAIALNNIGLIEQRRGDHEQALATFEAARTAASDDAAYYRVQSSVAAAKSALALGDPAAAAAYLDEAGDLQSLSYPPPLEASYLALRAQLAMNNDDLQQARQYIDLALALGLPDTNQFQIAVRRVAAQLALRENRPEETLDQMTRALDGKAEDTLNRLKEATRAYEGEFAARQEVADLRFVEAENALQAAQIRNQRTIIAATLAGSGLLLVAGFALWRWGRDRAEAARTISLQTQELKVARDQLDQRLREREVLMQELNHRVKNNIQLLVSLLNFQARGLRRNREQKEVTSALAALEDVRTRMETMALLHEMLAQEDFSFDSFQAYLEALVDRVSGLFSEVPTVTVDSEDLGCPIANLNTISLIVAELLANALEHAFPEPSAGDRVDIRFRLNGEDQLILTVTDNGVGVEADPMSAQPSGLGIVRSLVDSLDGSIAWSVAEGGGTQVTVTLAAAVLDLPSDGGTQGALS